NQSRYYSHNAISPAKPTKNLPEFHPKIASSNDDEMLRQKVHVHHGRVRKKWNILNPRHRRTRAPPAGVDENLVGFEDFSVNHDRPRRFKPGVALDDRAMFKAAQPFLHALVRPSGDGIL